MATQTSITINDGLTERSRTTSSGTTSRFSIEILGEPLTHQFDEVALGVGPAVAIKEVLSEKIKAIREVASPSTQLMRKAARIAFSKGSRWATRRYSGGRTGATPPGDGDALFNDSERLANGLFVRQNPSEKSFTVNVPANRFSESTFSREKLLTMIDRLRALVPALGNPEELVGDPKVQAAIARGVDSYLITKLKATTLEASKLRTEIFKGAIEIAKLLGELVETFSGE